MVSFIECFHMTSQRPYRCPWKQWNGSHVGVPNQSSGSWTISLCKRFLLFQEICIDAGHVSENTLFLRCVHTVHTANMDFNSCVKWPLTGIQNQLKNHLQKVHPNQKGLGRSREVLTTGHWLGILVLVLDRLSHRCKRKISPWGASYRND